MIAVLAAVLLSGCAQKVWVKPGATQEEFRMDRYQCEKDVRQSGHFDSGFLGTMEMQQFFNECMNAKGYFLQTQQTSRTYSEGSPTSSVPTMTATETKFETNRWLCMEEANASWSGTGNMIIDDSNSKIFLSCMEKAGYVVPDHWEYKWKYQNWKYKE
jgi:hypothetical protein